MTERLFWFSIIMYRSAGALVRAHTRERGNMSKKIPLILIAALMVTALAFIVMGCERKSGEAERIEVFDTHIYLAPYGDADSPYGDPSTYKIETNVYPLETADQGVHFSLKNSRDREYLSVGVDGTISAKGEVKADEEGNIQDIVVVVTSNQNPSLSVEITVTIEECEVERIYFDDNNLIAYLYEDPVQIIPRFSPAHAIIGRNVEFTSDDTTIADVDDSGLVTPLQPKKVAVWVSTPRQGAFDVPVRSFITIDARYADLNYSMDLLSEPGVMKQIYGSPETLQFTLLRLSDICDPEPNIIWYVNSTQIDDGVSRNNTTLNYTPSTLPPGEYNIRAELYNSTQSLTLVSETLIIYEPLQAISLDMSGTSDSAEFIVGDVANFIVTYTNGQYPPDQYRWTVTHQPLSGAASSYSFNRAPASASSSGNRTPDLGYQFDEPGSYTISVEAYVKGAPTGIVGRPVTLTVLSKGDERNIYGMKVDGIYEAGETYAEIRWDALPYDSEIIIEIDNGVRIVSISSDSSEYAEYFSPGSFKVPARLAGLDIDFRVRMRSGNTSWTEWMEYSASDIPGSAYPYFEEIVPGTGLDSYISDIEELGELINYFSLFRPETDFVDVNGDNYTVNFELYIPINYDAEISESDYPFADRFADAGIRDFNNAQKNAYKVLAAAIYSYVDTVNMSYTIAKDSVQGGRVGYTLTFLSSSIPDAEPDTGGGYENAAIFTHYSDSPRGEQGVLPIEKLSADTMSVSTSGQLLYALTRGYRPVPRAGSDAETVYNAAKKILNSVIGDEMTDYEKALAIYDWMTLNVAYDHAAAAAGEVNYSDRAFFIEGALFDGVAVCDGISKTYSLLMLLEGIHTYRVFGNSDGVPHAWNAAVIDGKLYYVDPTWANATTNWGGEQLELISYDTFMMTEEELDVGHVTYGVYPATPDEGRSEEVYEAETAEGFDFTINDDSEFLPLFGYIVDHTENNEVWVSVWIDYEYLNSDRFLGMTNNQIETELQNMAQTATQENDAEITSVRINKFGYNGWEFWARVVITG